VSDSSISGETKFKARLVDLFREVRPAHHQAYLETDGDDPEWPLWYAQYLQPKLAQVLKAEPTISELVYLLVRADREHRQKAPQSDWVQFYADSFVENYSGLTVLDTDDAAASSHRF
jgi:hypothetical protein